ncbi:MAG: U32 family peptidase [Bacilli bacterium]|nr:U32 family peptidase [Bacilli bacterium]
MKITVITNNINNINKYKKIGAEAFIFGLKNFSSGYNNELTLESIKKLRKEYDGELFIAINKNIFNSELVSLEEALIELDRIKIDGILFYDMAILSLKRKLKLSVPLVWNQTHMVTNYNTCNYYYEKGCEFGVLAGEITLDEVNEIKAKTNMKLFLNVFGYPIMGYTRRHLLNNFFKSIKKEKEKNIYTIKNNNEDYIVTEEENGNALYYGKLLNGSVIIPDTSVDYVILNDNLIDQELFKKSLNLFKKLIDTKDKKYIEEIDKLAGTNRGFFFKKTIYKVKKNG